MLYGGRCLADIPLRDRFGKAGIQLLCSTDDGSLGFAGLVTELAALELDKEKAAVIYACGPDPMMKTLAAIAAKHGVPAEFSLSPSWAAASVPAGAASIGSGMERGTDGSRSARKARSSRGAHPMALTAKTVDLSTDLGFLKLRNPVLTASGTFGYGLEFEAYMDLEELGGIIVKGLYYRPREGNPPPRLVETASGLINAIGLQGVGVEAFAGKVLPKLRQIDTPIIVNVCGADDDEYAAVVEFLDRQEGIAAYELNISCPNVKKEGLCPALAPQQTFDLVKKIKAAGHRPLITKLSPNVTSIVEIARAAEEAGTDAVALVNTFLAMAVDLETRRPKLGNVYGGSSGPAIKPIALRMVHQVASRLTVPVIGMGGIMTGTDALEFLMVGAAAVEVGTANFVDPDAPTRIVGEIRSWCEAHGVAAVRDVIGTLTIS